MLPHTRALVSRLMEEPEDRLSVDIPEPAMHEDPQILQLRMKRKYQLGMIKKMLEDSGYGDLAKMTTLSKRDYNEDID